MKQRILATVALWLLVIFLLWFLGKWGAFILIALFGVGSFVEFLSLMRRAGRPVDHLVSLSGFTLLIGLLIVIPPWVIPPVAILAICLAGTLVACLLNASMGTFTATAIPTLGSLFLLGIPMGTAVLIVHETGLLPLLWIVAVAKFGDVGALLTGMWIGRHRMAPGYSPNKTWEGFGGGVVLSILVSIAFTLLFKQWLPAELHPLHAAWMALFITLSAVLSDLMESAFKREAKAKDSGNIIPGIGGILDLTDSMILALPVGYFLLWLVL
ncbi:MAG: phosphatidate cytidylyltransferase [Oceanipulchritudo sp.]